MSLYKKCYFLFIIGGLGYSAIELLWRGYTHPSMGVLGGVCLIAIRLINKRFCNRSLLFRASICGAVITVLELITGVLLNIILKLSIWDYSKMPLNILGQICPLYTFLWILLSFILIFIPEKLYFLHTKKEHG